MVGSGEHFKQIYSIEEWKLFGNPQNFALIVATEMRCMKLLRSCNCTSVAAPPTIWPGQVKNAHKFALDSGCSTNWYRLKSEKLLLEFIPFAIGFVCDILLYLPIAWDVWTFRNFWKQHYICVVRHCCVCVFFPPYGIHFRSTFTLIFACLFKLRLACFNFVVHNRFIPWLLFALKVLNGR